ncbi:hypothetical protein BS47DRAFT_1389683 [Hydnum rufescens UP504]|uniref:Uncharacterized protein n=1 Tax=Hydnum rufescens UP504 TaxID=1448309 RepID=A0A9P6B533_9AGAM|nr:hypothetical protein BS47DRAFT_1389683 [Hydnum rufescens UP504]
MHDGALRQKPCALHDPFIPNYSSSLASANSGIQGLLSVSCYKLTIQNPLHKMKSRLISPDANWTALNLETKTSSDPIPSISAIDTPKKLETDRDAQTLLCAPVCNDKCDTITMPEIEDQNLFEVVSLELFLCVDGVEPVVAFCCDPPLN